MVKKLSQNDIFINQNFSSCQSVEKKFTHAFNILDFLKNFDFFSYLIESNFSLFFNSF